MTPFADFDFWHTKCNLFLKKFKLLNTLNLLLIFLTLTNFGTVEFFWLNFIWIFIRNFKNFLKIFQFLEKSFKNFQNLNNKVKPLKLHKRSWKFSMKFLKLYLNVLKKRGTKRERGIVSHSRQRRVILTLAIRPYITPADTIPCVNKTCSTTLPSKIRRHQV